ncbi:IclR family transcriptional regulator [Limnohabitans sp. Rim8]|uniref:IclR family transcriptional regulator n=1 Tax=Limnohabitans sp. Rim8 TaxID=1100718 RepID=UPI00261B38BE|nr:IclR family transcriptional regulator [Limnohabitans sp. Rim8]
MASIKKSLVSKNDSQMRGISSYSAPALEKGLDILEQLASVNEGQTLLQLAAHLGRSPSEIYRMLEVLVDRGYLKRINGTFSLSLKLFELGKEALPIRDLSQIASLHMHEVAQRTRQSLHLSMHQDQRLIVVVSVHTPEPLGFSVRLGSHYPFRPDRTSARVLTAFQPQEIANLMVEEMQRNALPEKLNLRILKPRLRAIRERGYEQSESDTVPGITDMAFPIFGSSHPGAIASLNMPYLKQRDATMSLEQSRQVLQLASQNITELMGGAGHPLAGA